MIDRILRYIVQIAVICAVIVAAVFAWQKYSDQGASEELGRLREKARADSIANDLLEMQLLRSRDSVANAQAKAAEATARWRAAIAREAAAPPLPRTATPSDTAKRALADLKSCREVRDSLATAIEPLQSKCNAYRVDAEQRIAGLERANANLDTLARAKRPGKRWHIGPSVGFGYTVVPAGQTDPGKDFQLERRLFVGVSVTRSIFSW